MQINITTAISRNSQTNLIDLGAQTLMLGVILYALEILISELLIPLSHPKNPPTLDIYSFLMPSVISVRGEWKFAIRSPLTALLHLPLPLLGRKSCA